MSVLTPLPGTRLYDEMKQEGRLTSHDWDGFNGKTRVAFKPRQMTPEELFAGYMWFRRQFYSFRPCSSGWPYRERISLITSW